MTSSLQWSLEVDMMDVGLGVSSFGAMPLDKSIHAAGFTCCSKLGVVCISSMIL